MSERTVTVNAPGVGFGGLLGIVFITLKLLGVQPVAGWSWVWVTCPLWISVALFFGILFVGFCFAVLATFLSKR